MAEIGTDISKALAILSREGVVGIPTETVYGLAGNALSERALIKIFEIKNRPKFDPLIAHVDTLSKVERMVIGLPEKAKRLAKYFWPGPLTMLLNKKETVPDLLTSGHPRVAVRIPNHPVTLDLLSAIPFPLAAPSANPFGYVSPTTALHVNDQLGDNIEYVLDGGACQIGVESTIVGFEDSKVVVYRLGGISVEQLEEIVQKVHLNINVSSDPSAPGMLKSHYAPARKLVVGNIEKNLEQSAKDSTGVISFNRSYDVPAENLYVLSPSGDLHDAARNIFRALRAMDQPRLKEILIEFVPDIGIGRAINDRIRRAAV